MKITRVTVDDHRYIREPYAHQPSGRSGAPFESPPLRNRKGKARLPKGSNSKSRLGRGSIRFSGSGAVPGES